LLIVYTIIKLYQKQIRIVVQVSLMLFLYFSMDLQRMPVSARKRYSSICVTFWNMSNCLYI